MKKLFCRKQYENCWGHLLMLLMSIRGIGGCMWLWRIYWLSCKYINAMLCPYITLVINQQGESGVCMTILSLLLINDLPFQRVLNDIWRTRLSRRRVIWLLPHPFPPLPAVSWIGDTQEDWEMRQLADGRGGGEGAKSYNSEKAWSSRNHSKLSGPFPSLFPNNNGNLTDYLDLSPF